MPFTYHLSPGFTVQTIYPDSFHTVRIGIGHIEIVEPNLVLPFQAPLKIYTKFKVEYDTLLQYETPHLIGVEATTQNRVKLYCEEHPQPMEIMAYPPKNCVLL